MATRSFLLILVLSLAVAHVASENYINLLVDKLMKTSITNFGHEIEPLALPDKGYEFKTSIARIPTSAIAKLYNTSMAGLSTMRRSSNATIETVDDTFTQLTFTVAFNKLTFSSSGKISVIGIGGHRKIDVKINDVTAKVVISYNMARDLVTVSKFSLDSLDNLTIKTSGGFRVMDALTYFAIRTVLPLAKKTIKLASEYALTKVMTAAVESNDSLKRFLG